VSLPARAALLVLAALLGVACGRLGYEPVGRENSPGGSAISGWNGADEEPPGLDTGETDPDDTDPDDSDVNDAGVGDAPGPGSDAGAIGPESDAGTSTEREDAGTASGDDADCSYGGWGGGWGGGGYDDCGGGGYGGGGYGGYGG
jgi:hypothetical protein